jgi:3-phenylpropionate/cinnamic acid dioxygenase small subunit
VIGDEVSAELQFSVERFLYLEAAVLDDRRFRDWLDLFADDLRYYVPTRYVRGEGGVSEEFGGPDDVALFDDNKRTLEQRIRRLESGSAWSEQPPSRVRHVVTNVLILGVESEEVEVSSVVQVHKSRLDHPPELWVGRRIDRIRRSSSPARWLLARRTVELDHTVLAAPNISFFF